VELVAGGIRNEQSSRVGRGINEAVTIKKRFDTEDIEIPFAYQNVVVKSLPTSAPARKPEQKDKDC